MLSACLDDPALRPLNGLDLKPSRILTIERAILGSSIERDQLRPRPLSKPYTIWTGNRGRTNDIPRPTTPHFVARNVVNLENPSLIRIAAFCNRDAPAGKAAVVQQLLHLLLDQRAVDATYRHPYARCVGAICICSEGRKEDGDGRACDLHTGAVDVGVRHGVVDPILEVKVDAVGCEVEFGAPDAAVATGFCEIDGGWLCNNV